MKIKIIIIFLIFGFLLSSLNLIEDNEVKSELIQSKLSYDWIIMFYFNGDNILSSYLWQRVQQISTTGSSDEVAVTILDDGNSNSEDDTILYYLEDANLIEQDWPSESDMSDGETLSNYVIKVMNDYESNNYYLGITSNKGSGWQGICWDDHGDKIMITMPEIMDSLNTITNNGENKLDVLHIESCVCGNFEVRYQLQSCYDYFIGYADCGVLGDINYLNFLTQLKNNPTISPYNLSVSILYYYTPPDDPGFLLKGVLCVTEGTNLEDVTNSIDELAFYFINHIEEYRNDIYTALTNTRIYGGGWGINYFVDLGHFLENIEIEDTEFINIKNSLIEKIDNFIIAKKMLENDVSSGLNIYFPREKIDYNNPLRYEDELPSSYEETLFAIDTNWDEFLKEFLGLIDNNRPNTPVIDGNAKGKAGEEQFFTISATDNDYDEIYYFIDWGNEDNSGWIGPYPQSEEIQITNTWDENGTFIIRVKARDAINSESDWAILEIEMPHVKQIENNHSISILIGKIGEIEKNQDENFRFLPVNMLDIQIREYQIYSFQILDETHGGYPCCGYINQNEFYGILTNSFIFGIWIV